MYSITQDSVSSIICEISECAQRYFSPIKLPIFFIKLLHSVLSSSVDPSSQLAKHIKTVALLKMGVETHSNVEDAKIGELILEGDYYSALFYQLCTEPEQVNLIPALVQEVSYIHRIKLEFYLQKNQDGFDEKYFRYIERVEAGLALALLQQLSQDPVYISEFSTLISDALLLNYMNRYHKVVDHNYLRLCRERIGKFIPCTENFQLQAILVDLLPKEVGIF